ncbi:MAG: ABC transporter permease [Thermoanaerobaculales bacterium]|nr:ABC transporter permease [Thermoanaerobaculales bacterium]
MFRIFTDRHFGPQNPLFNPIEFLRIAVEHRHLIRRLAIRQIRGKYVGSVLGLLWSALNPLFLLAVFTFVFSVVFQARWGVELENRTHFALVLFSGLLVYNLLQHCLTMAPSVVVNNPSFVKKVVFPLEILPWILLIEGIFHAVVGFTVFFVAYFVIMGFPPASAFFLPLVLLPLCLFLLGSMWLIASIGVYVRDLGQVMGVLVLTLMFLSPLFYPLEAVPERYRIVIHLSPLTYVLSQVREILFWGGSPNWIVFSFSVVATATFAWLSFDWFMVTKRGFSDVV